MVMAKKLTEERVAGLEKALGAVHQKMKDAEQNSELKEGLLKERDEELAKFRNWIKEHKHQVRCIGIIFCRNVVFERLKSLL